MLSWVFDRTGFGYNGGEYTCASLLPTASPPPERETSEFAPRESTVSSTTFLFSVAGISLTCLHFPVYWAAAETLHSSPGRSDSCKSITRRRKDCTMWSCRGIQFHPPLLTSLSSNMPQCWGSRGIPFPPAKGKQNRESRVPLPWTRDSTSIQKTWVWKQESSLNRGETRRSQSPASCVETQKGTARFQI